MPTQRRVTLACLRVPELHSVVPSFKVPHANETPSGIQTTDHLPHTEGGFGVTFNAVTKDDVFYTTTSRFVS